MRISMNSLVPLACFMSRDPQSARRLIASALVGLLSIASASPVWSQDRSRPAPPSLKDLDGHFPFTVPDSGAAWETRAKAVRLQTRSALGLHPMPKLAEPRATIHGRREMDGYSIEKVILESLPGHFITASLYRPLPAEAGKKYPAVMYAHGHWADGRFYEASPGEVKTLLASGAERFENAATNHMQAACVQLARMGVVAIQYDMIGYADSQQISFDRAHRFGINDSNPPATEAGWALFSPLAEGYGQSVMGLQTINSIQIFDMLSNLPDVDPNRIAITGASGGGTQSFIATAVDTRFAGALPAVMVSTRMQGGCTCENACGLRVLTGNIELAALTAPRPLGMTTANDWTVSMPEDGFPELQKLYALVGKPDAVKLFPAAHFPHNYNHVARVAMYGWVNRLFGLGLTEPILERDFELIRKDELTVFDQSHPRPAAGIDYERSLTKGWAAQIDDALRIRQDDSPEAARGKLDLIGEGWRSIAAWSQGYRDLAAGNVSKTDELAKSLAAGGEVEIVLVDDIREGAGKSALSPLDPLAAETSGPAPKVKNPRPAAAYTYGYNAPPVVRKLGVLLNELQSLRGDRDVRFRLVADDSQIVLASLAALQWPEGISSVRWSTAAPADFDPVRAVESIYDPGFIPNGLRYQGLRGLHQLLGDRVTKVAQ